MAENARKKDGKKLPLGKALRNAGYSDHYANSPKKLLGTETFKELLGIFLPEAKVIKTHSELMDASEIQHYVFPQKGRGKKAKDVEDDKIKAIVESVPGCKLIYIKKDFYGKIAFYQAPDNRSRERAIDMAYKLRGSFAAEEIKLTRPFEGMTDEELMAERQKLQDMLNKKPRK